ncbi:hypothetical protein ACFQ1S_25060 [Kibdelosporangium lantanae]|uniref:Uncharacterized protein n=1 Tax=Kibdelosporangium lantanae TaxID=1497396 RepID=A0ABW3MG13_9PSEU
MDPDESFVVINQSDPPDVAEDRTYAVVVDDAGHVVGQRRGADQEVRHADRGDVLDLLVGAGGHEHGFVHRSVVIT